MTTVGVGKLDSFPNGSTSFSFFFHKKLVFILAMLLIIQEKREGKKERTKRYKKCTRSAMFSSLCYTFFSF